MAGQATTQQDLDYYIRLQNEQRNRMGSGGGPSMPTAARNAMMAKPVDYSSKINELRSQVQAGGAGGSPEAQAEAAWKEAMGLLQKQGPYTPEVVNQLTNRRADQTAAAEAVNAEEIRNQAAARGMDPTQAIRGLQQGRQAQNVAFSGDIASQAAVQNFAAETPGRMAAAQANLNRQFGGATQPAVSSGGGTAFPAPRSSGGGTAFPAPRSSGGYNPGAVHQQAATMNQTRQPTNLNRPAAPVAKPLVTPAPSPAPVAATSAANSPYQPVTYGNTAFGPVSTAQNARSYQNIYKYTN